MDCKVRERKNVYVLDGPRMITHSLSQGVTQMKRNAFR